MKTKIMLIVTLILICAVTLSAQEAKKEAKNVADATPLFLWSIVAGTVGLAAAAIGGAFAQSKALREAVGSIGRNPSAADSIRGVLIIGLALIESLVIYVLLIDLILFFVKWGSYTF
jgi:F-type H+-transporting ATPase subunit c